MALTTASAKQLAHEAVAQNGLDWLERVKRTAVQPRSRLTLAPAGESTAA